MLSLIPLAATSAAPAVADVPTVCLETTIAANGRTRNTRIVEGSGDRRDDRGARRYLEVLDFARLPLGVRLGQTGHVIVEVLGPDTWRMDVSGGELHASCAAARAARGDAR